jgi:dTMP kinase
MIAQFLNGEFGGLEAVDPRLAALLYAGDRLEAKPELEAALAAGKTILADRYIASNLAHQCARVVSEQRAEFLAWLRRLEYEIYGLPAESLVIYLRVKPAEAQQRVERKAARGYTSLKRDLLESNLTHLEQAALVYDALAAEPNWVTVECLDAASETLMPPEEIHRAVLAAVEARDLSRRAAP